MPTFSDLYSPIGNLFTDNYNGNNVKVSVKSTSTDDLDFKLSGKRSAAGPVSGSLEWGQSFLKNAVAYKATGKIDESGSVNTTVSAKNLSKGLNAELSTDFETEKAKQLAKLKLDYTKDQATLRSVVSVSSEKKADLELSSVVVYENFAFGAKAKTSLYPQPKNIEQYDLSIRYKRPTLDVVAQLEKNVTVAKLGFVHRMKDGVLVGGELKQDLVGKDSKPVISGAVSKTYTNKANLRAKLNTKSEFGVAYETKLNDDLKSVASLEGNLSNLSGPSKVGLALTFTPKQ